MGPGAPVALTGTGPAGAGPPGGEPSIPMEQFAAILAVEPLTVEGLFFRMLLAETQGLRGRVADQERRPDPDDRG